jgi:hypothetical protein
VTSAASRVVPMPNASPTPWKLEPPVSPKQNREEQKRQDQKARKAGKAEPPAERGSAQYGYGSGASTGPGAVRRV